MFAQENQEVKEILNGNTYNQRNKDEDDDDVLEHFRIPVEPPSPIDTQPEKPATVEEDILVCNCLVFNIRTAIQQ